MKIKTQIIVSTAIILGVISLLQIFLYSILQHESKDSVSSIFNSIAHTSVQQIDKLNEEISKTSSLLAVHRTVQANLYEYSYSEMVKNASVLQNLLSDYLSSNQNIAYLGVIKEHALFMSAEKEVLYDEVRRIVRTLPEPKNTNPIFIPSFRYEGSTYFACATPIFPTNISYYTPNHTGNFIVCVYEMDRIEYVPSGIIDNNLINLVITDNSNRILLSTEPENHDKPFDAEKTGEKFLLKTIPLANTSWNANVYMSSRGTSIFSNLTLFFVLFMIIFTVAMLFLMLKLLNDIIIKRINLLKENVQKISDNDTTYRISYDYKDELEIITTTINRVLDKIHNLNQDKLNALEKLYHAELLQKETRIFYLYGQISPHFLYNSLSYIQGHALEYKAYEIVNMVISLSKVFRYFSNNKNLSTIQQDLNCAIEYFNVINLRRTHPITLINNVDENLYHIPCLKMIYQPILENVLTHAFTIDTSGTVTISSISHEDKVIIEIADNGKGISPEKLESIKLQMAEKDLNKIQNSEHIGLLNVNMRLKLYYNSECGIEITSEESKGTTVRIMFEKAPPQTEI